MSTEEVNVSELELSAITQPGEIMIFAVLIAKHPVSGHKLHLRAMAAAVEHLRTDERGRTALLANIDRLIDEFKRQIGGAE